MDQFVFGGGFVPGLGESGYAGMTNKKGNESRWDGGNPGLNYRFWDMAEDSGYKGKEVAGDDKEAENEEAAFLDNLFACRRQCKGDLGGASSLRTCIRACKGKGPKASAIKGLEAQTQAQMAASLAKMSEPDADQASRTAGGSSKTIWIIVGIVGVIGIAVLIYFLTRKKAVPVVA